MRNKYVKNEKIICEDLMNSDELVSQCWRKMLPVQVS